MLGFELISKVCLMIYFFLNVLVLCSSHYLYMVIYDVALIIRTLFVKRKELPIYNYLSNANE